MTATPNSKFPTIPYFAIAVKWESIYGLRFRMSHSHQRASIDNLYLLGIKPDEVLVKESLLVYPLKSTHNFVSAPVPGTTLRLEVTL